MRRRNGDNNDARLLHGQKVVLRPKQLSDAADDYNWRADPELAEFDAMLPLQSSYAMFLSSYRYELQDLTPRVQRFAITDKDGKHIGNCAYYGVDEAKGEAELGIMIGDRDYWDKGYGGDAINALVNHIFTKTNLNRIHLKTLDWNVRAQKCFQKCGFNTCGQSLREGHNFVLMEVYRSQWEKEQTNQQYK